MGKDKIIPVTRPSLPPLEEFIPYLESIWDSRWLTNNGPYHKKLEEELCNYLGVPYISLFSNGTLALIIAIRALDLKGEVITTPYSFVATAHSLYWNGIKPVFVDIEEDACNLDPEKIEESITPETTAILPVHVYGNPCKVKEIQEIADKHNLKVIYDAAHAFGVKLNGESILNYGDLSVLSFHATKVFNTFEGGAIVCKDKAMKDKIDRLKNFGFAGEESVIDYGLNAKMNEFQAALGLLQLKYNDQAIKKRKHITNLYRQKLKGVRGIRCFDDMACVEHNYSYYPIFIDEKSFGKSRDELYEVLKNNNIYGRRYFFPLISNFPVYKDSETAVKEILTVAEKIARQVLCLPLFPELGSEDAKIITGLIKYENNKTS